MIDCARPAIPLLSAPCTTLCIVLGAALAGCATGSKLGTIPSDGPTMAQIYRQHMAGGEPGGSSGTERERKQQRSEVDPAAAGRYQRTAANEIDPRFARLPNPDLVMYVAPHLSMNGRYPIPGYSTVFPMYETVEYAMPGEVPWRRASTVPDAATAPVKANTSMPAAEPARAATSPDRAR